MKIARIPALIILPLLLSFQNHAQGKVSTDDLKLLIGEWTGSLTYIDYSSNNPFTMPANLVVSAGKDENQLVMSNIYPQEPKANDKYKIKISEDGATLNKNKVTSRKTLPNGQVEITTEYEGKDNSKKATIKNIYLLSETQFLIRKEVKYEDSNEWFKRNEFKYSR